MLNGFRLAPVMVVAAAVVTFAGILVYGYHESNKAPDGPVPLVKAPTEPVRIRPEDAGGLQVPFQDLEIYGQEMEGEDATGQSAARDTTATQQEKIAPMETLMAENASFAEAEPPGQKHDGAMEDLMAASEADQKTDADDPDRQETVRDIAPPVREAPAITSQSEKFVAPAEESRRFAETANVEPEKSAKTLSVAQKPTKSSAVTAPVIKETDKKASVSHSSTMKDEKKSTKNAEQTLVKIHPTSSVIPHKPKPKLVTGAGYRVQLGSLRDTELARKEWSRLQKLFPDQLAALDLKLQSVDLGDRGTYHRIQAGPVAKNVADSICKEIKARNSGGCLVVKEK